MTVRLLFLQLDVSQRMVEEVYIDLPDNLEMKIGLIKVMGYEFHADVLGSDVFCFSTAYKNQHFQEKFASKRGVVRCVTELVLEFNSFLAEEFRKDIEAEIYRRKLES
jgi:hypothetical protein